MSDLTSTILRGIVHLVDGVMGVFSVFHAADRHISSGSMVGQSRVDREASDWRESLLLQWRWLALGLLVLAAFLGGGYWLLSR